MHAQAPLPHRQRCTLLPWARAGRAIPGRCAHTVMAGAGQTMTVTVTGAGGRTGKIVLQKLLAQPERFRARGLVRNQKVHAPPAAHQCLRDLTSCMLVMNNAAAQKAERHQVTCMVCLLHHCTACMRTQNNCLSACCDVCLAHAVCEEAGGRGRAPRQPLHRRHRGGHPGAAARAARRGCASHCHVSGAPDQTDVHLQGPTPLPFKPYHYTGYRLCDCCL
jgi:hypothetical protein